MADYELNVQTPSLADYLRIRLAAGLSRKTEEAATIGLKGSLFAVTVFYAGKPVGLGRIIGDGGCFLQVVDIAFLLMLRQKGVGRRIMDALMSCLHKHAPKSAYISLMADHGTPAFYEKFGFVRAELPTSAGMYLRV